MNFTSLRGTVSINLFSPCVGCIIELILLAGGLLQVLRAGAQFRHAGRSNHMHKPHVIRHLCHRARNYNVQTLEINGL